MARPGHSGSGGHPPELSRREGTSGVFCIRRLRYPWERFKNKIVRTIKFFKQHSRWTALTDMSDLNLKQSGPSIMQKVIGNKAFSRSEPSFQPSIEHGLFSRTLSHPSGNLKPTVADFFMPVNHIHPKAPAMFKSWELMTNGSSSRIISKETFCMYDPLRVVGDFSWPPKKFFRTFWRSAARKLIYNCNR